MSWFENIRSRLALLPISTAGLIVLVAVLLGGILRFSALDAVPPALNQDEAVNGYDAYSLFLTGRDHLGHPFPFAGLESFGDWASPLLTLVTAPAVGVFGLSDVVIRAVSAAIGVLAIPVVYLLGWQLFERRSIAVLAAWALAISPWHVHLSRWAIPPTVVPTMVALLMLAVVWTARRRSERGLVATGLIAGLTVAGYPTMKLYVPMLALAAIAIYGRTLIRLRREALIYGAICFAVIAGPVIYLSALDPGGRARFDQISVFSWVNVDAWFLLRQYAAYFSPQFLFTAGDGNPMHSLPGYGVELASAAPFLLAGLIWLAGMALRRPASPVRGSCLFLLAALALYPVPGSLTLPNPVTLRAVQLLPLSALIAGAGAVALWDAARRLLRGVPDTARRFALAALVVAAAILIHFELVHRYEDYFDRYPRAVAPYFYYGLKEALAFARDHEAEYDEVWVTDTNQPYIYFLFFRRWSPDDVHRDLQVKRDPPAFNEVYAFGKYRFVLLPADLQPSALPVLGTIGNPDGSIAYLIRGAVVPNHGRVLVIAKR